jgi:hypothetical protein
MSLKVTEASGGKCWFALENWGFGVDEPEAEGNWATEAGMSGRHSKEEASEPRASRDSQEITTLSASKPVAYYASKLMAGEKTYEMPEREASRLGRESLSEYG